MRREYLPSWRQELVSLEGKLRLTVSEPLLSDTIPDSIASKTRLVSSLHSLATLLWMNRSAMGYYGDEPSHQILVAKGLEVISLLGVCDLLWPLFIIACEARLDEQRALIMDTIRRTSQHSGDGHLNLIKSLIEAAWVYDDLDTDRTLNYDAKLSSIVQAGSWMPPFI